MPDRARNDDAFLVDPNSGRNLHLNPLPSARAEQGDATEQSGDYGGRLRDRGDGEIVYASGFVGFDFEIDYAAVGVPVERVSGRAPDLSAVN
jgi:hypothetical protein